MRCGVAGGKLIDRNQSNTEPSLSFKSQQGTSNLYDQSNAACLNSARMMVLRYHMLRSDFRGQCLYECKGNDFVGFTATVILLIGLAHSRTSLTPGKATMQELEDRNLTEHSLAIFEHLDKRSPCKLFSQSHRALFLLMGKEDPDLEKSSSSPATIFIPYFGKVSAQRKNSSTTTSRSNLSHQRVDTKEAATPTKAFTSNATETLEIPNESTPFEDNFMSDSANFWEFEPAPTLHDTFLLPGSSALFSENDFLTEAENFGGLPGDGDPFAWLNENVSMMDIDQDWSCLEQ